LLLAALLLLTLAVAFGVGLGLWHLRAIGAGPPILYGTAHAVLGTAGLTALLLALRGPPRGEAAGAGSFGAIAATLFGLALMLGLGILLTRRRRPTVIAIHAGLAVTGYLLLLAWYQLG
jgi:LPXTG-motif cell wall-anchored protein